ncbi:MAG: hypothetical protein R3E79_25770 [Caldilineaceae bacterium]
MSNEHKLPLDELSTDSAQSSVQSSVRAFDRRHFLGGMLSGVMALIATACGRSRATPTPTLRPTATPMPISQSSLMPTPTQAEHAAYLPFSPRDGSVAVAAAPT